MNNINGIGYVYNNGDKRQNPNTTPQEVKEEKAGQKADKTDLGQTPSNIYNRLLVNPGATLKRTGAVNEPETPEWTDAVNNSIQDFIKNPEAVEEINSNYEELLERGFSPKEAFAFLDNIETKAYSAHM